MRVRIIRSMQGEIDGVPLSQLQPGYIYDVNASIATYLIVSGWAAPVADMSPARIIPLQRDTRMHQPLPTLAQRLGPLRAKPAPKKR